MKAIYFNCELDDTVHHQELTDVTCKFEFMEIIKENTECLQYNPDTHCPYDQITPTCAQKTRVFT